MSLQVTAALPACEPQAEQLILQSSGGAVSGLLLGVGTADKGQPLIVCIHGGGCNGDYFNLGPHSIAQQALARRMPVLLVNRPGYAGTAAIRSERPMTVMAPLIRAFIDEVGETHFRAPPDIALVGHSIGGAIALMLARDRETWRLRALAVSGVGHEPSEEVRGWLPEQEGETVRAPLSATPLYFGPQGSYDWRAPLLLRRAAEPWVVAEVLEMLRFWPQSWPEVARRVAVPVQLRLSENDRLWQHDSGDMERIAASLTAAPFVDAALLAGGGHLYELHKGGPALAAAQLDFLERSSALREAVRR